MCTVLLQGDDHGAGSEGVPGRTVVGGVEVGLHDVVDGEGGEDSAPLGLGLALLHRVPLQQCPLLLLPHVLLPRPHLRHTPELDAPRLPAGGTFTGELRLAFPTHLTHSGKRRIPLKKYYAHTGSQPTKCESHTPRNRFAAMAILGCGFGELVRILHTSQL